MVNTIKRKQNTACVVPLPKAHSFNWSSLFMSGGTLVLGKLSKLHFYLNFLLPLPCPVLWGTSPTPWGSVIFLRPSLLGLFFPPREGFQNPYPVLPVNTPASLLFVANPNLPFCWVHTRSAATNWFFKCLDTNWGYFIYAIHRHGTHLLQQKVPIQCSGPSSKSIEGITVSATAAFFSVQPLKPHFRPCRPGLLIRTDSPLHL